MSSLPLAVPASPPDKPERPKLERSQLDPAAKLFLRLKKEYRIYDGRELGEVVARLPSAKDHLVAGFLPARSVNILVGESGIGKSSLALQLALAVAAGKPFLDLATRQGKVMFIDYENAPGETYRMLQEQCRNLGVEAPYTLQIWPMQLNPALDNVEKIVAAFAPDLVIVDSLRSFSPGVESDNITAIEQIRRLRVIAVERGTAFLFIHHLRKGRAGTSQASLEESGLMDWLSRAAGVRALINQTDVRLAVSPAQDNLVMRGYFRTRGEIGPFYLRRVPSESGDANSGNPIGYARTSAPPPTLDLPDQAAAFLRLPASFSFKDARIAYGRQDPATNLFLQKLVRLGLVNRDGHGKYCKTEGSTPVV